MAIERAAGLLVGEDILVDAFVADVEDGFPGQPEAGLLRAPVLAQQSPEPAPGFGGNAGPDFVGPALEAELVGLLRPIAAQASVAP